MAQGVGGVPPLSYPRHTLRMVLPGNICVALAARLFVNYSLLICGLPRYDNYIINRRNNYAVNV